MKRNILLVLTFSLLFITSNSFSATMPNRKVIRDYENMKALLLTIDRTIVESRDEDKIREYILPKNLEIINYVKAKYDFDLESEMSKDDPNILAVAFAIAGKEQELLNPSEPKNVTIGESEKIALPQWVSCLASAITGIGVVGLQAIYNGTVGLMTASTISLIVKNLLKKYLGFFGAVVGMIEYGNCMNWW